jgi:hypothetical protein
MEFGTAEAMSRPAKKPTISFDDAAAIHALRAAGIIYAELGRLFQQPAGRVTQVLMGELHDGSWVIAVERLERGEYWHPRIAELAATMGHEVLLTAARAGDPARRRYLLKLKRLRKTTIPFVAERPTWELPRFRRAS